MSSNVFRLYTFHKTEIFLDGAMKLRHAAVENVPVDHVPVYARADGDELVLFLVKDNRIHYISEVAGSDNFSSDETPAALKTIRNDDGSITIVQGKKFLSARKDSGAFDLRPKNLDWEHLFLDPTEFTFEELIGLNHPVERVVDQTTQSPFERAPFKVSVIIPLIDPIESTDPIEETLERSLKSLRAQTLEGFEVILVDGLRAEDHSLDNPLVKEFGDRLSIVKAGASVDTVGALFNIGIDCAVGKYILMLDSGDSLKPDALASLYSTAEKTQAAAIFCAEVEAPVINPLDVAKRVHDFVNGKFGMRSSGRFLSREFLVTNRIEFPKLRAADEVIFSFYLACLAKNYVLVPDPIDHQNAVEHKTPESSFFSIASEAFDTVDKFMNRLDFFKRRSECKYVVFNRLNEYCKQYLDRGGLSDYKFYEKVLEEVRHNRSTFNRTAFLAFNFCTANWQYAQILKRDKQIRELNKKIKEAREAKAAQAAQKEE